MSIKTKNIITIVIAAVALVAVIVVTTLAAVTVNPTTYADNWLKDYASVEIYYGGQAMNAAVDENGKLLGNGDAQGEYSVADVFDSMNFSLFSACIQFNYDFGLSFEDASKASNNEITVEQLKERVRNVTAGSDRHYSFIVTLPQARELSVRDNGGTEVVQTYDTVLFTVTEDSDWARNLSACVFLQDDLNRVSTQPGDGTKVYYKLKFGARTSTAIDILDLVYGNGDSGEREAE